MNYLEVLMWVGIVVLIISLLLLFRGDLAEAMIFIVIGIPLIIIPRWIIESNIQKEIYINTIESKMEEITNELNEYNGNLYIQKIIVENEDKIEELESDRDENKYRVIFDDFFFDFKVINNVKNGKKEFILITDYMKVLNHLNIYVEDISIDSNEVSSGNYNKFKEKYMNKI